MDRSAGAPGGEPGRRRYRRPVLAAVLVLGLLLAGWLLARGLAARAHLRAARAALAAVEQQVRARGAGAGDAGVRRDLAQAEADTRAAARLTSDPLWRLAGSVPVLGCPLRTGAGLSAAAARVPADVLTPLLAVRPALVPVRTATGVQFDLARVRSAAPQASAAAETAGAVRAEVAGSPSCGPLGRLAGLSAARTGLRTDSTRLAALAGDVRTATALLPPMLGADGPRRYLLVVQNSAESRATGGILGGVGVLSAASGTLSFGAVQANSAVPPLPAGFSPPLPPDVAQRYARNGITRYWQDANLSPDFPTAARVYAAMWQAAAHQHVDGVLATDPTALSYLLAATGPARLPDGTSVGSAGLVPLLESKIYATLPTNAARDAYFAAAGTAISRRVLAGGDPARLLPGLARAAGEGRLLVWSTVADEQGHLAATPLGGALPTSRGPYLAVVTQNAASGKLDYYLHRSTEYVAQGEADGSGSALVTVRLTNAAPSAGLSPYVLAHDGAGRPIRSTPGRNVLYVSVFAGVGASFEEASLDGAPTMLESESERGHSVFSTHVQLDPGATRTLRIRVLEPDWRSTLVVRPQPLVHPERLVVRGIGVQSR